MENNKNKKSVKFQGDMLNLCDFIQVFVFTTNYHLKRCVPSGLVGKCFELGTWPLGNTKDIQSDQ